MFIFIKIVIYICILTIFRVDKSIHPIATSCGIPFKEAHTSYTPIHSLHELEQESSGLPFSISLLSELSPHSFHVSFSGMDLVNEKRKGLGMWQDGDH
uniref:Uncharacterized protein n=1 Tax=Lepeophtheirus salmonis TaxID=72036 RepID=A0A0K2TQP3_LEPSM